MIFPFHCMGKYYIIAFVLSACVLPLFILTMNTDGLAASVQGKQIFKGQSD